MTTPEQQTQSVAPPAFAEFRRRCGELGVAAWWFDAVGRPVEGPIGVPVTPALRRAVERAAASLEDAPALPGDRRLLLLPDDAGRTAALLPAHAVTGTLPTDQLADVVRAFHADLTKADADGKTLDAFSAGLSQSYEEVTFLFRIARLLNAPDDPPAAIDAICRQLLDVVPFGWITLYFRPLPVVLQDLRGRSISAGTPPCSPLELVDAAVRCCADAAVPFTRPRVLAPANDPLAAATGGKVLAVPVAHDRQCVAVLLAGNRHMLDPDVTSGDMKFLGAIADLLGVFHENMCRFAEQREMSLGTVRSLANAIDAKDAYTRGHSERVALLCAQLAAATGADPATVDRYRVAGLIHDVGKIGVPEAVLCKAGRLTEDEFRLIQKHPAIGVTILQDVPGLHDVMGGVLHHHERFDGRGYPHGLRATDIPLIARCMALADTFDAMSSNRSYRAALPREQVLAEITGNAGSQFDPALAPTFVAMDFTTFDDMLTAARGAPANAPAPASVAAAA